MQVSGSIFLGVPHNVMIKIMPYDSKYSGASSNSTLHGSKQNCRIKQSAGLNNSLYRKNREMGARKTAGLSGYSVYEGAGLAAPLLYYY